MCLLTYLKTKGFPLSPCPKLRCSRVPLLFLIQFSFTFRGRMSLSKCFLAKSQVRLPMCEPISDLYFSNIYISIFSGEHIRNQFFFWFLFMHKRCCMRALFSGKHGIIRMTRRPCNKVFFFSLLQSSTCERDSTIESCSFPGY